MIRGRKPKPTALRLLEGKSGTNPNEPIPAGDLAEPPEWMTDAQQDCWRYAIENAPAGLLKRLDQSVLSAWVVAQDLHQQANAAITTNGMMTTTPNGYMVQSPWIQVLNKQAQIMMRSAEILGFAPSARSRIQVSPDAPVDEEKTGMAAV